MLPLTLLFFNFMKYFGILEQNATQYETAIISTAANRSTEFIVIEYPG